MKLIQFTPEVKYLEKQIFVPFERRKRRLKSVMLKAGRVRQLQAIICSMVAILTFITSIHEKIF
jgi:hypothetical protein